MEEMDEDFRETLVGLFTEIAIIEHLMRTRMERLYPDGLESAHFGILNHLLRNSRTPERIDSIAWSFQEELDYTASKIATLESFGFITTTPPGTCKGDTVVALTDAGEEARNAALDRMAPDVVELISEIDPDQIRVAHKVLEEIRLTLDNLPDR